MTAQPTSTPLRAVLAILDRHSDLMGQARVFGSGRNGLDTAGDLDVGIVLDIPYDTREVDKYRRLLRAGARGTPRYGYFDLFLVFKNAVLVRNDDCLGFVRAKNAIALRRAVKNGEPWAQWRERLDMSDNPHKAPLDTLEQALRTAMCPDMLVSPYKEQWSPDNPTLGFCSMASEAAWFVLGGSKAGWSARVQREDDGTTHWWLEHADGTRFDPTADQYRLAGKVPPYERGLMGHNSGFMGMRKDPDNVFGLGLRPGRRAQAMLERAGLIPGVKASQSLPKLKS